MKYCPHVLYKKSSFQVRDDYERIVGLSEDWIEVCRCRCDDSDTIPSETEAGVVYNRAYHIVLEGHPNIQEGDVVAARKGETEKGQGIVRKTKSLNYLDYSEIWVQG